MEFTAFRNAVKEQFDRIKEYPLLSMEVRYDELWDIYLETIPEEINPIFQERRKYDCQACRSFFKVAGNMVAIIEGELVSIWDVNIDGPFKAVAKALATKVKACEIRNRFLHTEAIVGHNTNYRQTDDGVIHEFDHFKIMLPSQYVEDGPTCNKLRGLTRDTYNVFRRSLNEISQEALDIVMELIDENNLYRGEEHKWAVHEFRLLSQAYHALNDSTQRTLFCWEQIAASVSPNIIKIRSTAIGSLLVDLSDGHDLEEAVKAFERIVAPENYQRPNSLITKGMIASAKEKVSKLGFTAALHRRYATTDDVNVTDLLFVDRSESISDFDIFDQLEDEVTVDPAKFNNLRETPMDEFLEHVLPQAKKIEVLLENRMSNNMVSLIAPEDADSKNMFKWPNNFSWTYMGEVTDSIKQRVKAAGGNVTGDLRCSLGWSNTDDLDIHMEEPSGEHIYFQHPQSRYTGGRLDIDMNAQTDRLVRGAVENIYYPNRRSMQEGRYNLVVHNFCKREFVDVGFEVEIEFDGKITVLEYAKPVANRELVKVAEIEYSHNDGFKLTPKIPSANRSKTLWGLSTQKFHKVNSVMLSPNHWNGTPVGNKHFFFMLEGCANEKETRGFFNEYLTNDLKEHRKVFEIIGAKMKVSKADNQLSGLGFSSTKKDHVICRVVSDTTRVYKITI